MKHTAKIITLLTLLLLGCSSWADSFDMTLTNATAGSTDPGQTVYVYPDASLGYFIKYINYSNGCAQNSTCPAPAGAEVGMTVLKVAGAKQTTFCIGVNAPSGSFQHCAPNACQLQVNYSSQTLVKLGGADCAKLQLPTELNAVYTIKVV